MTKPGKNHPHINYEHELRNLCRIAPDRIQRKSLRKHLEYLNQEIVERKERGESVTVMQSTFDCLLRTLELLDAIGTARVAMNGGGR